MNIFWTIYVYVAVGLVIMGVLLVIGTMITCKIGKDLYHTRLGRIEIHNNPSHFDNAHPDFEYWTTEAGTAGLVLVIGGAAWPFGLVVLSYWGLLQILK